MTDTIRKGVVDVGIYNDTPQELLVGQVAILSGGITVHSEFLRLYFMARRSHIPKDPHFDDACYGWSHAWFLHCLQGPEGHPVVYAL